MAWAKKPKPQLTGWAKVAQAIKQNDAKTKYLKQKDSQHGATNEPKRTEPDV